MRCSFYLGHSCPHCLFCLALCGTQLLAFMLIPSRHLAAFSGLLQLRRPVTQPAAAVRGAARAGAVPPRLQLRQCEVQHCTMHIGGPLGRCCCLLEGSRPFCSMHSLALIVTERAHENNFWASLTPPLLPPCSATAYHEAVGPILRGLWRHGWWPAQQRLAGAEQPAGSPACNRAGSCAVEYIREPDQPANTVPSLLAIQ